MLCVSEWPLQSPPPSSPPPPPVFSLLASGSDQCVSPWQVIESAAMCQTWFTQREADVNDGNEWIGVNTHSYNTLQPGCTYHVTSNGNTHRAIFNTHSGASTHASYRRVCYQ